jgi:hypothetical protein
MDWLTRIDGDSSSYTPSRLTNTHKACRDRIDPLENRVARNDQDLWNQSFDLVESLRTVARTVRRLRADELYNDHAERKAIGGVVQSHARLLQQLGGLTGEPPPPSPGRPGTPGARPGPNP